MSKKKQPKNNPLGTSSDTKPELLLEELKAASEKYQAAGGDDSRDMAQLLAYSRVEFTTGLNLFMNVLQGLNKNITEFRDYLAESLTEQQIEFCDIQSKVGENLVRAEEKFVKSCEAVCDAVNCLVESSNTITAQSTAHSELLRAHNDSAVQIVELFKTFVSAFADVNAKVDANSQRIDKLIATIERYYGDGTSLEFEN